MSIDSYISFTNDNDFSSNDEWEIINGPVDTVLTILPEPFPADVIQEHNIVPGKEWIIRTQDICFKISISNYYAELFSSRGFNLDVVMKLVTKIPSQYLMGLAIVSEPTEHGLGFTRRTPRLLDNDEIKPTFGIGRHDYLFVFHYTNLRILLHEIAHVIGSYLQLYENDFMDRWENAITSDGISVSEYGNTNVHEDMAEFGKIYAKSVIVGQLAQLEALSPERFQMWQYCLEKVNNDYRPNINAICSQVTQPQYLVVDPPPSTDPKPIPIAKYWRITYKVTHPTSKFGLYSSYIYHGIEVMHSRITDLSQIPDEGGILPLISADSRNVNVSVSTNYNPFKFPTITWTDITWDHYVGKIQNYVNRETRFYPGTFKHNDTTFIGDVNSIARELYPMVHYNNDRQTMISYGGMIRYTFDTDIEVNEIIYAPRYCDYCLADSDYSSKILIEYSNDGENWSTDHEYVKGVDYENGLVAHELNVSDAMFLQRDLSTGHWKPGVIKRRMRGRNPIYPNYILCNDVTCTDIVPPDTSPIMPSERNFLLKKHKYMLKTTRIPRKWWRFYIRRL